MNRMKLVDGGLLVFALLLFLHDSLQQTCPAAPTHLSLTTEECGVTGAAREGTTDMEARQSSPARRNWLYRLWNGFLSGVVGGQLPEPDPLIINGSPATITEAPFMAHLFMEYSTWGKAMTENCSGSIISHRWILTAAHCLHQGQKSALVDRVTVRVGSADRGTGTAIAADAFRVHPDFNPKNLNSGNDIALVHLNADLTFGPSIQPLCYPTSDDVGAATAPCDQKVYGWGILSDKNKVTPRNLQKLDVSVSAKAASDCSGVDGKIVCVTGKTPGSGPCRGDSGGPLAVRYGGVAYASGVFSYYRGFKCTSSPTGYTRSSAFAAWVQSQITAAP